MLRRNGYSVEARVLVAALFIAVMSVTTVSFFADRVRAALDRQANELIAADAVVMADKPIAARFREEAARLQLRTAESTTFPSMVAGDVARGQGVSLAELKAVSTGFPLRGKIRITDRPGLPDRMAEGIPAPGTIWVPEVLLARLHVDMGDELTIGAVKFRIVALITKEPDRVLDYFGIAPRVMLNMRDLAATKLMQVGSRVTYRFLVAGDGAAVDAFELTFKNSMARGERLETVRDSRAEVRVALDRAQRLLGLAALLSVVLASVAVALAARRFSQRQLDGAAMMRCLGAVQADIFALHFWQFAALGAIGSVSGVLAGFAAQSVLAVMLGRFLTVELPLPGMLPALQGLLIGVALVMGFTLPPLLALRRVPTLRVLRRDLDPFEARSALAYLLGFATLAGLILWRVGDLKMGAQALAGFVIALGVAALLGWLLIRVAARMRGAVSGSWRYGIANMQRRAGGSLVQIVALSLGIMAMLLLTVVRTDMIGQWQARLSTDAPNRFVVNVQADQLPAVRAYFAERDVAAPELFPMVRGRLVEVNGAKYTLPGKGDEGARRLAEREFNLSWMEKMQADNSIVAGTFWEKESQEKQFSVEEGIAKTLRLNLGDKLTFDIAGSRFTASITSIRKVEWDSFRPNFFVIANPGVLDGYPASYITSFYLPPGKDDIANGLVQRFPNLSVIDLSALMEQVRTITDQVARAVSYVFLFALAAGLVVLYAAIASTQDDRIFDAAIMRTLGASRRQMMVVQLAEFLAIGLLSGLIASVGAIALAMVLADRIMSITYVINWWIPVLGILGGGIGVAVAGLIGTRKAVELPPLATLRAIA
ncbi:MAG: ABC transporter permease [Betaproteobacteria bacterium]|nr:ABC transporter permease [Betaproteobacteria bacterium]